jgi:hypothetical protein
MIVTSANPSSGWKLFRRVSVAPFVLALACVLLWGAMFARIADKTIGIDKDWLYLYLCGIELVHPALHEQQIDLVKRVVAGDADDQVVYRATVRANYCNNYPFTSLSMYLAGKWQTYFGTSPEQDYATFIRHALWSGIIVSGGVLGILCLLVSLAATEGPLRLSICAAIGLAALCYLAIPPPSATWMFYQSTPVPPGRMVNLLNTLGIGLHSWFNPGAPYTPFSTFPRCLCALLTFTAFALRWSGRPSVAYCVPLLVSLVHQSSASILLLVLVCCDIVVRPRLLARRDILFPIALNVLVIAFRERMFAILGFSSSDAAIMLAIVLAIVLGAGLALAMLPPGRAMIRTGWSLLAAWRGRTIAAVPLPFADALVVFAMWFGVITVSYLASRNDVWLRVIYFWSELSPRYVGMFQLSVFAGILYPLIVTLQSARPTLQRAAAVSAAVIMLAMAASQLPQPRTGWAFQKKGGVPYDELTMRTRNAYVGSAVPTMKDETSWYYLLVRNAILGDSSISAFFGKT